MEDDRRSIASHNISLALETSCSKRHPWRQGPRFGIQASSNHRKSWRRILPLDIWSHLVAHMCHTFIQQIKNTQRRHYTKCRCSSKSPGRHGTLSGLPGSALATTCSSNNLSKPCMAWLPIRWTCPLASGNRHANMTWYEQQANHQPLQWPCQVQRNESEQGTPCRWQKEWNLDF